MFLKAGCLVMFVGGIFFGKGFLEKDKSKILFAFSVILVGAAITTIALLS